MQAKTYSRPRRYYAFRGEDGFFIGHNVLRLDQIELLASYNKRAEHFTAIELYDNSNEVIGSQLCFDIDFEGNLHKSYHTMNMVCDKLDSLGLLYDVWFSGNKGMHIVVPELIMGSRAHIIAKAIKRVYFNITGVDEKIYRERSLLRVEGSLNAKSGLYKIKIDRRWSIELILQKAKHPVPLVFDAITTIGNSLSSLIQGSRHIAEMLTVEERSKTYESSDYFDSMCIKKMWADDDPPRDMWHDIIYTLAKHFYNTGRDSVEIIDLFDEHPFWSSISTGGYNRRSYVKVINSLGKTTKHGIGCKRGQSAEAMQLYCTPLCFLLDSPTVKELINGEKCDE